VDLHQVLLDTAKVHRIINLKVEPKIPIDKASNKYKKPISL
jgi:hypothetical protein